ncbi:transglycosylase SLT domain-containing protein [Marinobacterium sp. AK62]|uniref:Transglycosylase SLT domain-containing protein n=1 Tax=Marinobacterium alkalitolerans TaxID=1542925 RepID=A0ABS3Z7Z1_9GAMM|nr:transglycosylase SLT domain-containing protein [Marinobacterium alkalitolerans]MBP0047828.1 transglycosylase SLT domain-containing protein [Marinobacterium alkalitolerans]
MRKKRLLLALPLLLTACATTPPSSVENACRIFREKPDWFDASLAVEKKYGLPVQVQLAIMRQESSFKHNAAPPRETFLGIPLWWRESSAYGYAQVKDETWDWYKDKTGNWGADRDEYDDAVDFMGWYADMSQKTLGISKWDAYNQYLAYHEGHGGWQRKTYNSKGWLVSVARKVDANARMYGEQLRGCRHRLNSSPWWWPF